MSGAVPAELVAKLSALKTRMPSYTKDEIQDVVQEMLASMEGDLSEMNLKLYAEVESLARYIVTAKSEIAALRPDEIMSQHLPSATDELDACIGFVPRRDALDLATLELPRAQLFAAPEVEARVAQDLAALCRAHLRGDDGEEEKILLAH